MCQGSLINRRGEYVVEELNHTPEILAMFLCNSDTKDTCMDYRVGIA